MPKLQKSPHHPEPDEERATNQEYRQLAQILHAVLEAVRASEHGDEEHNLNLMAQCVKEVANVDVCLLLKFDDKKNSLSQCGISGELNSNVHYNLPLELKTRLKSNSPLVIVDTQQDDLLQKSDFFEREKIQSVIIFPLSINEEYLGLFLANYRQPKIFSGDEIQVVSQLADLTALTLHNKRLSAELDNTQQKIDRRLFLVWISMIEATWRHSLVQKAATIRNFIAIIHKQLEQPVQNSLSRERILTIANEIDQLATDIANAPSRVPQSLEMEAELIPLSPLLVEIVEKEKRTSLLQIRQSIDLRAEVGALNHVQIKGHRRWLIYALEALLQNAYRAMPNGGNVTILCDRVGSWAEVRIKDTGGGIPNEIRTKLFREIVPKRQDSLGMGIGSLLAATIVEEHSGTIELEKPGPNDTTVLVRLPIVEIVE